MLAKIKNIAIYVVLAALSGLLVFQLVASNIRIADLKKDNQKQIDIILDMVDNVKKSNDKQWLRLSTRINDNITTIIDNGILIALQK